VPPRRTRRCSYREGNRRCPYDGDGQPILCRAHRIAVAEASRPKAPLEVLLGSLGDLLAGNRVDADATIGAATSFFGQWSEQRSAQIPGRPAEWTYRPPGRRPQPEDPDVEVQRVARSVMGFTDKETLTVEQVKDRKRVLAKRHHPDRGGSVEMMARINDAADVLLASL
jgi:hypothetical protein